MDESLILRKDAIAVHFKPRVTAIIKGRVR
jgi:hypothetical protein